MEEQAKPNGKWPSNTWFQRRLAEVKQKEAREILREGGDSDDSREGVVLSTKS